MDEKPYRVGKWHEQDNYECLFCPHATTSEAVAKAHYVSRHVHRPTPPPPSPILVADKSGREVKPKITATIEVDTEQLDRAIAEAMAEETKPEPAQEKPPAKPKRTRSITDG